MVDVNAETEQFDIKAAIQTVVEGGELSAAEASRAMDHIMSGEVTPAQIGAFLIALRMRGETVEEIAGFAAAMREHSLHVDVDLDAGPLVDTCGTGGDASGTYNISTTASFAYRRSRRSHRQARQPLCDVEMRLRRPARGAGGGDRALRRKTSPAA